jgi:hypothetical protein
LEFRLPSPSCWISKSWFVSQIITSFTFLCPRSLTPHANLFPQSFHDIVGWSANCWWFRSMKFIH